jgi:hypothetical protein
MSCTSTTKPLADDKKIMLEGVDLASAKQNMFEPEVEQISILACVKNKKAKINRWHCDNKVFNENQMNEAKFFEQGNLTILIRGDLMSVQFSTLWGFYQALKDVQLPLVSPICSAKMIYSKTENYSGDSDGVCYFEFKKHTSSSKK